jgi:magnesium-dependent phosphatase 1
MVDWSSVNYRANQCLRLLLVPPPKEQASATPKPAIEFFDELEIYPGMRLCDTSSHKLHICTGSKLKHFKALHERTGIPYSEMVLKCFIISVD